MKRLRATGISENSGSTVSGNTVYQNGSDGISTSSGRTIMGNTGTSHTLYGLNLTTVSAYRDYVVVANSTGAVRGASLGGKPDFVTIQSGTMASNPEDSGRHSSNQRSAPITFLTDVVDLLLDPGEMSLTSTVATAGPSLFHSSDQALPPFATRYGIPFTFMRLDGLDPNEPGSLSFNSAVPAALPSLLQKSRPAAESKAAK